MTSHACPRFSRIERKNRVLYRATAMEFRRALQSAQEVTRFAALHLQPPKRLEQRAAAFPRCPTGQRVVFSLTTTPDRIHGITPTLVSLLDQTCRADGIYLNIPNHSLRHRCGYEIPPALQAISSVTIVRCERDWGPATKLIPTLQREGDGDTLIVVVDDDQIYPRCMLETFVAFSQKSPEAALCSRGFRIPPDFDHAQRDTLYGTDIHSARSIEIMQGSAGFLVKPRFFTPRFFDYEAAPRSAFYCDDIWMAGNLARNGVRRVVIPFGNAFSRIETLPARRTKSLCHNENRDQSNNNAMYRHFQNDWELCD
jgi:hypothetical protein